MNTFPAKLDTLAKMLSVAVVVVLIFPFITIGQYFSVNHDLKMFMIIVLVTAVMIFTALFMPKSFTINPSVLKITQVGFSRIIPMENIDSIEPVGSGELGFSIRTFGSGGFLGYLGKFWYKNIGHVTAYVTDRSKILLVRLKNGRKILISPDDVAGFLKAWQQAKT